MRHINDRDRKAAIAWCLYIAGICCLAMVAGSLVGTYGALGVTGVAFLLAAMAVAS